ncbi:hypothetical protein H696_02763 [Fonticula alba]|uniref:DNA-directed RNA polymerase I, II, and III subunit RPABC4 n=1 Tax=Fonticula alba TaxID=691883 RepID=A0A058Z823_FONAL|nr:hypothetical protein H696_02763 [Fonticula alba]KCV70420.1 hypothetical protein H696_02763 [Fonticula alba]|eukprot:XP_009494936.1 hypothetical protein H696_02763 [Fonticula alba]
MSDDPRYICAECGHECSLSQSNKIQCTECGYRVLYKKRTKNIIQFEAR